MTAILRLHFVQYLFMILPSVNIHFYCYTLLSLMSLSQVGRLKALCESFFKLKGIRPRLFIQEEVCIILCINWFTLLYFVIYGHDCKNCSWCIKLNMHTLSIKLSRWTLNATWCLILFFIIYFWWCYWCVLFLILMGKLTILLINSLKFDMPLFQWFLLSNYLDQSV